MYMVISQWEVHPGHEQQMRDSGARMREFLRSQPGVEFCDAFRAEDGRIYVMHGYADEATYHRIIDDPNGGFQQRLKAEGTESHARWVSSVRGETEGAGVKSGSATVR